MILSKTVIWIAGVVLIFLAIGLAVRHFERVIRWQEVGKVIDGKLECDIKRPPGHFFFLSARLPSNSAGLQGAVRVEGNVAGEIKLRVVANFGAGSSEGKKTVMLISESSRSGRISTDGIVGNMLHVDIILDAPNSAAIPIMMSWPE